MSKVANLAAMQTFAEAVNTGKYELFEGVVAPDSVDHDPGPGQVAGPEGYRTLFADMRNAFPDMKVAVETMIADEDTIALAYTFTGTQDGPLMGVPATGKTVRTRGMQISKFKDGKMVERWGSSDELGMLKQIGASVVAKP